MADRRPLIYPATTENYEVMAKLAKDNNVPLGVKAEGLDALSELTEKIAALDIKDMVIDPSGSNLKETFQNNIYIIPSRIYPLLVMVQNIYTDPQKPMQVEEGIYEVNNPDSQSPVLITTNFSLTYFIVNNEVEGSKLPAHLMVMDVEGLSVLTAWGAGKFIPDQIAQFIKRVGIQDKVEHQRLIIPGYVAQLSGELEDELTDISIDIKVDVGPREAGDIPAFLKEYSVA